MMPFDDSKLKPIISHGNLQKFANNLEICLTIEIGVFLVLIIKVGLLFLWATIRILLMQNFVIFTGVSAIKITNVCFLVPSFQETGKAAARRNELT